MAPRSLPLAVAVGAPRRDRRQRAVEANRSIHIRNSHGARTRLLQPALLVENHRRNRCHTPQPIGAAAGSRLCADHGVASHSTIDNAGRDASTCRRWVCALHAGIQPALALGDQIQQCRVQPAGKRIPQ